MGIRLHWSAAVMAAVFAFLISAADKADGAEKAGAPNVLVIITDDQGHGDLGCHGNPKIRTPNLDRLASQGVQLTYFYVSPVCAPTRASLMTGRWNYRTGVVDTYLGRAMMHPDEVTLAEMLGAAGYRCGIFGKWHLGDNYPLRPQDQGFHEVLVHKGGGIGQPSDPPGGNHYLNPFLEHNGKLIQAQGYCSNVFTDAALRFIAADRSRPFFAYLAFNCPHTPLEVQESDYLPYKKLNLAHGEFPKLGHPLPGEAQQDVIARVYGMVTNIDDNLGRLFARLDELKLSDNTIVIFLTDNGPQQVRYNSGLRERKGSVHDGGIRVPCFIRWPGRLEAGRKIDRIAAHIDLAATLLDACGVKKPEAVAFDGRSLLPLLKGEKADWPERTLYFQWHRGDEPVLYRAFAARTQRWKLVQPTGAGGKQPDKPRFLLFDMEKDPLEMADVAEQHADVAARMKQGYEAWFKDVGSTRGYGPVRIHLGAPQENPSVLTRQDWRGPRAGWGPKDIGHWEVHVTRAAKYQITVRFAALKGPGTVHFKLGNAVSQKELTAGAAECRFDSLPLAQGPGRLEAWVEQGKESSGATYVEVKLPQ